MSSVKLDGDGNSIIGIELIGKTVGVGLNIERYFQDVIAVGTGIAPVPWGNNGIIVPIYFSFASFKKKHSPYASFGVSTVLIQDIGLIPVQNVFFAGGYQYRSGSGIIIRPSLNILIGGDFVLPVPGVLLGKSF